LAIDAWSKSDDPQALTRVQQLLDTLEQPDTIAYNALCNLYAKVGDADAAMDLYRSMLTDFESGKNTACQPDPATYLAVFKALQTSQQANAAQTAEEILSNVSSPSTILYNSLLNMYAQNGDVTKALNRFQEMQSDFNSDRNKACRPNVHTYSAVLNALHRSKLPDASEQAEKIFRTIPSPNTVAYNTMLSIYAKHGQVDKALKLLQQLRSRKKQGSLPDVYSYGAVLNAFLQSDSPFAITKAEYIFRAMATPNTVAYNTMLRIYAQQGNIDKTLALFKEMQSNFESGRNKDCPVNVNTYSIVLNALQQSNLSDAVEQAHDVFRMISLPNTIAYNMLMNMYAQRGDARAALVLLHEMQAAFQAGTNTECQPDMYTYSAILTALHKSSLPDALEEADRIVQEIVQPSTIVFNALLNIYSERASPKDAVALTERMLADFVAGTNPNCKPDELSRIMLQKALRLSTDQELENRAKRVFNSLDVDQIPTSQE
jgi:pentatricopeptide repeat protein